MLLQTAISRVDRYKDTKSPKIKCWLLSLHFQLILMANRKKTLRGQATNGHRKEQATSSSRSAAISGRKMVATGRWPKVAAKPPSQTPEESSWGIHLGQQFRSAELKNLGDVNCTPAPIRVWD